MTQRFSGRPAVVTGGGGGIGAATARRRGAGQVTDIGGGAR